MVTKIKVDKIEGNGFSDTKIAHLVLTFDTSVIMRQKWNIQSAGMSLMVKGNHNTSDLSWLMGELEKTSKVSFNVRREQRQGALNFNNKLDEIMTLEGQICKYVREVIKAHDFINTEKTLTFKVTAKKTTAKKK